MRICFRIAEWSRAPLVISFGLQTIPLRASRPCSDTWSLKFAIGARQTGHEQRGFKGGRRMARGHGAKLIALGWDFELKRSKSQYHIALLQLHALGLFCSIAVLI